MVVIVIGVPMEGEQRLSQISFGILIKRNISNVLINGVALWHFINVFKSLCVGWISFISNWDSISKSIDLRRVSINVEH